MADHDRPLNSRGARDAPRVGRLVRAFDPPPGRILSSSARRAALTAAEVARWVAPERADQIMYLDHNLYLASAAEIVEVIRELGGEVSCVLVVGHNPGLDALGRQLADASDDIAFEPLKTAALAKFELDIDAWTELRLTSGGRLTGQWSPRDLGDE